MRNRRRRKKLPPRRMIEPPGRERQEGLCGRTTEGVTRNQQGGTCHVYSTTKSPFCQDTGVEILKQYAIYLRKSRADVEPSTRDYGGPREPAQKRLRAAHESAGGAGEMLHLRAHNAEEHISGTRGQYQMHHQRMPECIMFPERA